MSDISHEIVAVAVPYLGEVPLQFDRPTAAIGGMAIAAASVAAGMYRSRQLDRRAESELVLYPDPDMAEVAEQEFSRESRVTKITGVMLGLAAGSALANIAGPSVVETNYSSDRVTVIVDASVDSRAKDVIDTDDGESVTRLEAGLNSGLRFADKLGNDVQVQFVFSGSPARSLGEVTGVTGSESVVGSAEEYTRDLSTASESPDIAGALAVADAFDADHTIVITSDDSIATADAMSGYDRALSVLSPGTTGTKYRMLGEDREAGYTAAFGESIKGTVVQDTSEIQQAMDKIIDTKIEATKEVPSKFYENLRNISGIALGLGLGALKLKPLKALRRSESKGV
jgi:hypothetical protein